MKMFDRGIYWVDYRQQSHFQNNDPQTQLLIL